MKVFISLIFAFLVLFANEESRYYIAPTVGGILEICLGKNLSYNWGAGVKYKVGEQLGYIGHGERDSVASNILRADRAQNRFV